MTSEIVPAEMNLDGMSESDVGELLDQLAQLARDQADEPVPIAAGTFALYPMADGGMMFVTSVDHGPLAGIKHSRIPPGLMRAMSVLAGGGSKMAAFKALSGFGRRREIEGGK